MALADLESRASLEQERLAGLSAAGMSNPDIVAANDQLTAALSAARTATQAGISLSQAALVSVNTASQEITSLSTATVDDATLTAAVNDLTGRVPFFDADAVDAQDSAAFDQQVELDSAIVELSEAINAFLAANG
ncbi:hypothetical protein MMPV_004671 [Pyropia vietnamensis]